MYLVKNHETKDVCVNVDMYYVVFVRDCRLVEGQTGYVAQSWLDKGVVFVQLRLLVPGWLYRSMSSDPRQNIKKKRCLISRKKIVSDHF